MKILIVSDAWLPQINGVVRTLSTTCQLLQHLGHEVQVINPEQFTTVPCPTYPEIRLTVNGFKRVGRLIEEFAPDSIHIATEGPLGWLARWHCIRHHKAFTTSFHTRFPEYVYARFRVPLTWTYSVLRRFHRYSAKIMVTTPSMYQELSAQGFESLSIWSRGVDVSLFRPRKEAFLEHLPRPLAMYVGRVAVEKNIEAFLNAELPGSKVVVGDGPQLPALRQKYPAVHFVGLKKGEELARYYAAADVFVFPSRTDTFGLVMLEALACGTPVAAYPVPGPLDVIGEHSTVGCLHENLEEAVRIALTRDRAQCRAHALRYSWQACTQQFLDNLQIVTPHSTEQRLAPPAHV
ncbi:alpha-mannosyltransferase [Thioflexithrix psekupsensis]|uniref:Alpha-mannosyltransferase n=1 Tax=Thioflexithrix psekupsensis TaxID=1570016 RepID=A0A251X949_9GAMM|nr:alpha-mannosyltransferase [Thioflexithrix psekupsensis]